MTERQKVPRACQCAPGIVPDGTVSKASSFSEQGDLAGNTEADAKVGANSQLKPRRGSCHSGERCQDPGACGEPREAQGALTRGPAVHRHTDATSIRPRRRQLGRTSLSCRPPSFAFTSLLFVSLAPDDILTKEQLEHTHTHHEDGDAGLRSLSRI